jgi:MFS family permease
MIFRKFGLAGLNAVDTANLSANIVSTLQAGCFAGALGGYPIADKWGRRLGLMISATVGLIGIIFQFASAGYLAPMYIGRYALLESSNRTAIDILDFLLALVWDPRQ